MKRILATVLLVLAAVLPASAEEAVLPYKNLNLLADVQFSGGKERVVLILHGSLSHNRMKTVADLQKLLAAKGFSTLAPNLSLGIDRRQGAFDCAAEHRHRHTDALDELGAWMDWLGKQGVKDVALLGFSRGGDQAAWFAAEKGHALLKRLVLVGPMTWTWESAVKPLDARQKMMIVESLKRAKGAVAAGRPETLFKDLRFLHCDKARVAADTLVSYYDPAETRRDTPGLLATLKLPFLVVAASQDQILPDLLPRLKAMPEARDRLAVVEGADHFFNDIFAEEAVDAIAAFLKK
ncbi:MAG: alpha/beta hydrolase [Magnetospirillum sp. WYHS-4]